EDAGQTVLGYVSALNIHGGDTALLGTKQTASLTDAVFANSTFAHVLDYDDDSLVTNNHPSSLLVPTLLSCTSKKRLDGADVLTAYVAGLETQYHLAHEYDLEWHVESGWHATPTLGIFGVVAATANLLDLSPEETEHAFNIASSMPAGLRQNFGTMTKPLHVGHAARSGLTAVLLASEGFTADKRAFDEFVSLYMGGHDDTRPELELEHDWLSLYDTTYHLKKYPCCGNAHAAIAGALELSQDYEFSTNEIHAVTILAPEFTKSDLQYPNPSSGLEAKFSMEYAVAKALVEGELVLGDFTDEQLDNEIVEDLRQRILYEGNKDIPFGDFETTVEIELQCGTTLQTVCHEPPGTHENPLTDSEIESKFMNCATQTVGRTAAARALEQLLNLRNVSDVSKICDSLRR
ncbi:MmgE/PrpD family protein, partial [Haloferax profundi]|uniref:MmgE/PrpD family protein n=1 Tax=Haloferax profundi TaxID=1544718 RepID=UPI0009EAE7C9